MTRKGSEVRVLYGPHKSAGQRVARPATRRRAVSLGRGWAAGFCEVACEVPVGGRHIGSGRSTTLCGRGSGSWATPAPVPARHLSIRDDEVLDPFAVGDQAHDQGGAHRAGGAGTRGTAV